MNQKPNLPAKAKRLREERAELVCPYCDKPSGFLRRKFINATTVIWRCTNCGNEFKQQEIH